MAGIKGLTVIALLVIVANCLAGCASPASKIAIVAHDLPCTRQHQHTVAIVTQGGGETGTMDFPTISNNDFAKAIEESIIENNLFTQVINGNSENGSDYLLSVSIINMSKPMFGANLTVNMEAGWSLSDLKTKKIFMRKAIKSSHTATMKEAFVGVTRFRFAVEGAIRKNIESGLMAISKLELE